MNEIKFASSGKQQYNLAGKVTVEFSPTDMNFLERVISVFKFAEDAQAETEEALKNATGLDVFDIARKKDVEIREKINELFGAAVCTDLFGDEHVWSRNNGFPIWANLLTAILDVCYDNLPKEEKATKARIDRYTLKYRVSK